MAIGGASASTYGGLTIADTALLDGELAVRLANGFTPGGGDIFSILTAPGGVSGVFANLPNDGDLFATADGFGTFVIDYTNDAVFLTNFTPLSVPEPSNAVQVFVWLPVFLSLRMRQRIVQRESAGTTDG